MTRSELLPELDLGFLVRCANISGEYDAIAQFYKAICQDK